MEVTRRYWGETGLLVTLTGLAVFFSRPFLLIGAAGIGGWLVARQYAFVRSVSGVSADLSIVQSPDRDVVHVEDDVKIVLTVELPRASPVALDIRAKPPVGVKTEGSRRVSLGVGDRTASETFTVRCPLAGEFEFDSSTVIATDETGRFRTTFSIGSETSITVNPRGLRNIHVGGEPLVTAYSDHVVDERGSGIDLADIRPYIPGDPVRRIDWNATARFDQPHVREFETQTDHRTVLLLDCRPSMAVGSSGETMFDYARHVALDVVRHIRNRGEPIGVYTVGEEGLLLHQPLAASDDVYESIERRIRELSVQDAREGDETFETARSPADVRRHSRRLRDDGSAFATRLHPFLAQADPYVEQITGDPLYGVVRSYLSQLGGVETTVVITDDTNPTKTRETVKFARQYADHVLVFLTPTALFELDATDFDVAYERYTEFERFRRELARIDRVSAIAIEPGDRLEAVLSTNSAQREAEEAG
ncbi:DUF58 domain-containing protein [Haladaptatus sp. NG-SE-30]